MSRAEVTKDIQNRRGNDLVKGILDETSEPAPKDPFELWHDEERDKQRSDKHANGGGDESVSDDNNRYPLGCSEQDDDDRVNQSSKEVRNTWRIDTGFEIRNALNNGLKFCLINL